MLADLYRTPSSTMLHEHSTAQLPRLAFKARSCATLSRHCTYLRTGAMSQSERGADATTATTSNSD